MTKEELHEITNWKNDILLETELFSKFLFKNILVQICFSQYDSNREISDFTIKSLNDFLKLENSKINWIKSELWKVCLATLGNASYGLREHVKDDESELEANQRLFGIYTSDDAFNQATAKFVVIDNENTEVEDTYFWLEYSTTWDIEHNVIFTFKNGQQYTVE